jgi:hypothetical protein
VGVKVLWILKGKFIAVIEEILGWHNPDQIEIGSRNFSSLAGN